MAGRAKDILDVFPVWKVENDCIISTSGDYTVCYKVTLPEIFTLMATVQKSGELREETGDFRDLNELWSKAFAVLPDNTCLHKQDWFVTENYSTDLPVHSFLDKSSRRHFNERPFLKHVCYMYVTKLNPARRDMSSLKTTLLRGRFMPRNLMNNRTQDEFFNSIQQFESIITSSKMIGIERLTADEIAGSVSKSGKPVPGLLERYMALEMTEDIVPLSDVLIDGDIQVGNKMVRFFTMSDIDDLPENVYTHNRVDGLSSQHASISVSFATPVSLMLAVDHCYNQYIYKLSKQVEFPKLEARSRQMKSLASFSKDNEANATLINQYLEYSAETGYPPVQAHFNLMVWTEDIDQLTSIRGQVTSAISKMGIRPRENSLDGAALFWAGIPGAASDLPTEDKFWTFLPQAACLLNMESPTHDDLSLYGVKLTERLSGMPIMVDLSDAPMKKGHITNRNKFILGPSGSGKSFLTNHMLRSYHSAGAHAVIVDVGDSYQGLCAMLGGKYLTYQVDDPISFNPFFIESRLKPDIEKLEAIKALLLSLWKKEEESLTRLEETALSSAVTGYFKHLEKDIAVIPGFNSFYDYLLTGFNDFLREKKYEPRHFDYDGFLLTMEPFYKGGEYDYLLNSTTNLDLINEPFIVFELDNIKDNKILFPVVTIIIMDTFITKMRQLKGVRKIILIEEAWKAIMKAEMAEYIKYLYKTVRKHFGEAWIVTQEVDDIINNPIVKDSIINNADTKILMDQRKYANKFDEVQKFLAMTNRDKNLALSLNKANDPKRSYKEMFVSFGGQHSAVYGVEVSKEEYRAFSTEQTEKHELQKLVVANDGNYDTAIRELLDVVE